MAGNKARLTRVVFVVSVFVAVPAFAHRGWDGHYLPRRPPSEVMVDVINNLGLALLEVHNEHNENNIAVSPYGAASVLVAVLEGVVGDTAEEIRHAADLPQDLSVIRVGLRDIHRHLKSYFIPKEGFLAGLTLSHENISLNREYESILRFYGYDIESFNVPIYPLGTAKPSEETSTFEEPITTLKSIQTTTENKPETSTETTTTMSTTTPVGTTEDTKATTNILTTTTDESAETMTTQTTTNSETIGTTTSIPSTTTDTTSTTNLPTTSTIIPMVETTSTTSPETSTKNESTTENNVASTENLNSLRPERTTRLDTTLEMSTLRTRETTLGSAEDFEKAETRYPSTITQAPLTTDEKSSEEELGEMTTVPGTTVPSTMSINEGTTAISMLTPEISSEGTSAGTTTLQTTQNLITESTSLASQSTTETVMVMDSTTSTTTLTSTTAVPVTNTETTTDETAVSTQSINDVISTLAEELKNDSVQDSDGEGSEILEVREMPGLNLVDETTKESMINVDGSTEVFGATITVDGQSFFDISSEGNSIGSTSTSYKENVKISTVDYEDLKQEVGSTKADFENSIESSGITTDSPSTTLVPSTTNNFNTGTISDIESSTFNTASSTETKFTILNPSSFVTSDLSDIVSTTPRIASTPPSPLQSSGTTAMDDFTFEVKAKITKRRTARSVIDYIIARYYDTYQVNNDRKYLPHHYPSYHPEIPYTFLVNGNFREPNISFMTYDTVLPFGYIPGLNAMALSFPLDSAMYYLLLVLPVDENGIDKLIYDFRKVTSLKEIVDNLKYTHIKAVIPSFMLRGFVVLTPTLQKMGIRKIFEPRQGDFSQLTPEKDIYVTNVEQAVTVTIRNYLEHPHANSRTLQEFRPVEFRADHPFLYFVMDSQIHVNLMAGKIVNPLNSRIR